MSKVCTLTGKKRGFGRYKTYRGIAKCLGGIGIKVTGGRRRHHHINLKKRRLQDPVTGTWMKVRLTSAALRSVDKLGLATMARRSLLQNDIQANRKASLPKLVRQAKRAQIA